MLCGKEFRKSSSYHVQLDRCVSADERLNDEVLLLRAGMTCQQTTTETLTTVCGETLQAKPKHKNHEMRDCVSMTMELPPVAATVVGKAATIPVEKDTSIAFDDQWSTVHVELANVEQHLT